MMRAAMKKMMVQPAKFARSPWIELTVKCRDWVQCVICDEYICLKCYDKANISADANLFCSMFMGS